MAIFIKSGFSGLKSNKKYRHNTKGLHKVFTIFIIIILIIVIIWSFANKEVMPVIRSMARHEVNMIATKCINESVNQTLKENKVTTQDLLFYDYNEEGEVISWNVNSIMINHLCTQVSENIAHKLQQVGTIRLKIPSGSVGGASMFSNLGPKINVGVFPKGSAYVDYKNELINTGINQVNHVVWLEIETNIQIVAPLSSEEVVVKRKIILVDKVISGKVPSSYINVN